MIEQALTFISIDWLKPLVAKLKKIRDEKAEEIRKISDSFGDPKLLARYYVEPNCQHLNYPQNEDPALVLHLFKSGPYEPGSFPAYTRSLRLTQETKSIQFQFKPVMVAG